MNVLETERLILRHWRDEDLDDFVTLMSDPDVARFISPDGKPQSRDMAWRSMATTMGHIALKGYGMWAVELKETGKVIGRIGPHDPEGWPQIEVGYGLAKPYWGKGYASEAVVASIRWAFDNFPDLDRIIHLIEPENAPSIALAERLGNQWKDQEIFRIYGIDARVYSQTRAEFAKRWG